MAVRKEMYCDVCHKMREQGEKWLTFEVVRDRIYFNLQENGIKQLDFCSRECLAKFVMDGGFDWQTRK